MNWLISLFKEKPKIEFYVGVTAKLIEFEKEANWMAPWTSLGVLFASYPDLHKVMYDRLKTLPGVVDNSYLKKELYVKLKIKACNKNAAEKRARRLMRNSGFLVVACNVLSGD